LPPGLFNKCGVGTLRRLYDYICMNTMIHQFPDDAEERTLDVLMYTLANPAGQFEYSKSAIDLWAQSDAGRSYKSWILSTFPTATSVDMIARRVFVLISIESFIAKDGDDLEDPPEPLADLLLLIKGTKAHDLPLLLRTLFNAIRDYMLITEKERHWWKEMLDAFETCAPRKSHWSMTEGGFVYFLEKIDKHGKTPGEAWWATRGQLLQVVTKLGQQTDPYNWPPWGRSRGRLRRATRDNPQGDSPRRDQPTKEEPTGGRPTKGPAHEGRANWGTTRRKPTRGRPTTGQPNLGESTRG
jgi:hypothetical protein